jgi:putative membrane protein
VEIGGVGFGGFWLMTFLLNVAFVLVLVAAVALGVRWLVRSLNSPPAGGHAAGEDSALAVLRERFARGEIDADEFEQRRRTLGS